MPDVEWRRRVAEAEAFNAAFDSMCEACRSAFYRLRLYEDGHVRCILKIHRFRPSSVEAAVHDAGVALRMIKEMNDAN